MLAPLTVTPLGHRPRSARHHRYPHPRVPYRIKQRARKPTVLHAILAEIRRCFWYCRTPHTAHSPFRLSAHGRSRRRPVPLPPAQPPCPNGSTTHSQPPIFSRVSEVIYPPKMRSPLLSPHTITQAWPSIPSLGRARHLATTDSKWFVSVCKIWSLRRSVLASHWQIAPMSASDCISLCPMHCWFPTSLSTLSKSAQGLCRSRTYSGRHPEAARTRETESTASSPNALAYSSLSKSSFVRSMSLSMPDSLQFRSTALMTCRRLHPLVRSYSYSLRDLVPSFRWRARYLCSMRIRGRTISGGCTTASSSSPPSSNADVGLSNDPAPRNGGKSGGNLSLSVHL